MTNEPTDGTPPEDAVSDATPATSAEGAAPALEHELEDLRQKYLRAVADYQNLAYAREYLDRLKPIAEADKTYGNGSGLLLSETARELALGRRFHRRATHAFSGNEQGRDDDQRRDDNNQAQPGQRGFTTTPTPGATAATRPAPTCARASS